MNKKKIKIEIGQAMPLTENDKILIELGKRIKSKSLFIYSNFCKFMVTTSVGAIPIYLALLKLSSSESTAIPVWPSIVPILFFIFGSILFLIGYFPRKGDMDFSNLYSIKEMIIKVQKKGGYLVFFGSISFLSGVIFGVIYLLWMIN